MVQMPCLPIFAMLADGDDEGTGCEYLTCARAGFIRSTTPSRC